MIHNYRLVWNSARLQSKYKTTLSSSGLRENPVFVLFIVVAVVQKAGDKDSLLKGKRKIPPKMANVFGGMTVEFDSQKQAISRNPQKRRKRGGTDSASDTSEAQLKLTVLQRAQEVQANLSPEFPSLLRSMLRSHVSGGFWLRLPKTFCQLHLPKVDTIIVLEDECGELYETKYLAEKVALSGGWRGFSIAHNLLEMDVLIFHLVQPSKFKVYIIRSQRSDEVDGALSLLKLDNGRKEKDEVDDALDATRGNDPAISEMIFGVIVSQPDRPENTKKDFISPADGIRFAESVISFEEMRGIENFSIHVNGLVIDSELPKYLRAKYYELCYSRRSFLHDHLIEGLNCKLVAGIISETINIADAIKASKLTTSEDSFVTWYRTLKAFEAMGMEVSFLLNRLDQLMALSLKSKRYKEGRLERQHAEEELKILEAKLVEVKQAINRLDEEIDVQRVNPERLETMFHELANAPW